MSAILLSDSFRLGIDLVEPVLLPIEIHASVNEMISRRFQSGSLISLGNCLLRTIT